MSDNGRRQKHISAFNVEVATGCKVPGLFGKNKLFVPPFTPANKKLNLIF
jgi:hypothetical protein